METQHHESVIRTPRAMVKHPDVLQDLFQDIHQKFLQHHISQQMVLGLSSPMKANPIDTPICPKILPPGALSLDHNETHFSRTDFERIAIFISIQGCPWHTKRHPV